MINARIWNAEGIGFFGEWLGSARAGEQMPKDLLVNDELSSVFEGVQVNPDIKFSSRFDFGCALNEWFMSEDFDKLMSPACDGLWAWLAAAYFDQLTDRGVRRKEHYIVMRSGATTPLTYRHAVRTSYALVNIHGKSAKICLNGAMNTFGDMAEQLTSRQTVAYNRSFFQTAYSLYMHEGKLRAGVLLKLNPPAKRKSGETTGKGGVRRLAIALKRLDLTYDTEEMSSDMTIKVLPKEFDQFRSAA